MLLAFTFYNIQPFLFPCVRVDQQGWLPQRKGIGHSLVLCATAGKFRVIYGHQHIRLLDDPPIGHKLCVGCLLIVHTGKVGAVRQHIEIAFTQLRRPLGSLFFKRGYANKAHGLVILLCDEVATLTEEKMEILREIFWDMNAITYWTEIVPGGKDEADTVILHIIVTIKTHLQMADEYQFNTEQRRLLEELMQPKYQELFMALTGSYQNIELSPENVAKIMENLPADLSAERRQVVLTAYQLLGKVHYFWGGKSLIIGWDSRWGMPMKVTAEGSSTTGTVRPFGLDCSGMVDWVFYNQSGGQYVIGHGGGATAQHSYCTPIAWSDAQPGDLVFYPGDSHVGIVCGFDSSGNIMVIHCASSENNVVVTGKSGFTSIGRPEYFAD